VAGSGDKPRWRVFVSHTSELRDFPKATSYVAAAERAIIAAGHVPVDMTDFPAADQAPADLCAERVRDCDVYIGVLGTRYGSPVRDKPDVSKPLPGRVPSPAPPEWSPIPGACSGSSLPMTSRASSLRWMRTSATRS
jgi:Domain of unknown function (DUF4062)